MRVALLDDEPMALENLNYVLDQCAEIEVVGSFSDPIEALQKLVPLNPDAVFLDIEMPQINGFVVAEEISTLLPNTSIVFVTGFNEYAVKAFEINAVDYLVKPASTARIVQTISRLRQARVTSKIKFTTIFKNHLNKIVARKDEQIFLLNPEQILCFFVEKGEVFIATECGDFEVQNSLIYWEERLAAYNFFRCHRAFLINLNKIQVIQPIFNNTFDLKLSGYPITIPVSRNHARELKKLLDL